MLDGVDVLLFDIQDVGARAYTYVSTMAYAMQSAKQFNKEFWVFDRPNPIGGASSKGRSSNLRTNPSSDSIPSRCATA